MRAEQVNGVAGVVLAAGGSARLGRPKQLEMLGGERLLSRAIRVAEEAGLSPIVVVLGAAAEEVLAGVDCRQAVVVVNEEWREGIASSIRTGIAYLDREKTRGAILIPCDQPAITGEHLRRLIPESREEVRASGYAGQVGIPAFFASARFADLLGLRGDVGAKGLLRTADAIELPGGELDVDTPAALQEARERFE